MVQLSAKHEISYTSCRSKLAEALEKILKAELIRLGWPLRKTHDLQYLSDLLLERGSDLAQPAGALVNSLSEAYMVGRYPGFDLDDSDWPALNLQIAAVSDLLEKVRTRLSKPNA